MTLDEYLTGQIASDLIPATWLRADTDIATAVAQRLRDAGWRVVKLAHRQDTTERGFVVNYGEWNVTEELQ